MVFTCAVNVSLSCPVLRRVAGGLLLLVEELEVSPGKHCWIFFPHVGNDSALENNEVVLKKILIMLYCAVCCTDACLCV